MTEHRRWDNLRARRFATAPTRLPYDRARTMFALGLLVRGEREEAGLSQRQLAEKIGTTQSAIARLEAGGVMPTIDSLQRIARALGRSLEVSLRVDSAATRKTQKIARS